MASMMSRPMPGHANTVSTMTAPDSRTPSCRPIKVTSGIIALKNAMIPLVTLIGLQLGVLLSGAVIVETVFAWPGIGRLIIEAIHTRDYPLVQRSEERRA